MNTIMMNVEDVTKLVDYEVIKYFKNFIFDSFKVIVRHKDCKIVYKVNINGSVNEVNYRIIKDGSYKDCKFIFTENEEGYVFNENPNGDLVVDYVNSLVNRYGRSISNRDIMNKVLTLFRAEAEFIIRLKQYIMNESYKRITIQKESCSSGSSTSGGSREKNRKKKNTTVQFLLGDIVEYVSSNRRNVIFTCECWSVRGHFRHYKDGKIVWISAYEKGTKRNSGEPASDKIYTI